MNLPDPNVITLVVALPLVVILTLVAIVKLIRGPARVRSSSPPYGASRPLRRGTYRYAEPHEPRLVWELMKEPPIAIDDAITIGRLDADDPDYRPVVDLTDSEVDPQPLVSRHHAKVFPEDGRYYMQDIDAVNPSRVNENRLVRGTRHELVDGARVVIRPYVFTFRMGADSELETWGDFEIVRLIAYGGMSEVYEAKNMSSGNRCALKVQIDGATYGESQAEAVMRMERERSFMEKLNAGGAHPHVVSLIASGKLPPGCRYANRFFISMELVGFDKKEKKVMGGDLRERMTGRPMGEAELKQLTGQICDALSFVHEKEIVHCDFRPENLLFTKPRSVPIAQNTVKLVDFGISVPEGWNEFNPWGEEGYMSPEHITGGRLTARSDLYSLGCTLYELLAAELPYEGPDGGTIKMQHADPTRRPVPVNVKAAAKGNPVSTGMNKLVMSLLEKDEHSRPATAKDVAQKITSMPNK